jgi:hypothetical protein
MPPSGEDEPAAAPSQDEMGHAPEGGGQEHWPVDQVPQGAVEDPGDVDDGDAIDEYEEEWDGGDEEAE